MKLKSIVKELISEQAEAYSSVEYYLSPSNCANKEYVGYVASTTSFETTADFDLLKAVYDGGNFGENLNNFVYKVDHDYPGMAFGSEEFMSNLVYNTEDMIEQGYCFSDENVSVSDVNFGSDTMTVTLNGEPATYETGGEIFKMGNDGFYLKWYHNWDDCQYMGSDCEHIIHEDGNYRIKTMDNMSPFFSNWQEALNWLNDNIYTDQGSGWVQNFPLGSSFTPSEYEQWVNSLNNLDTLSDHYVGYSSGSYKCMNCPSPQPAMLGCMNNLADNFNLNATEDDGTCCSDTLTALPSCIGGGHPGDPNIPDTYHTAADGPIDDTSTDNVVPIKEPIKYDKEEVKVYIEKKLEDGRIIKTEDKEFKVGSVIMVVGKDGKLSPLAPGDYTISDGDKISIDVDNKITRMGKEEEKPKEKFDYIPDSETPVDRALKEEIKRIRNLMKG
tara:strand:- start:1703 stop:3028 length:1326 start_codon:yes stop_codon:yes gene_type:complete